MSKPAVLFVTGSWHVPAHFGLVREVFENAEYEICCPRLPSNGSLPSIGLKEDAEVVRGELDRLIETEGKDVIIVSHSYGGVVTSEASDAGFAKTKRSAAGKPGGILRLVYMCAFVVPLGTNISDLFGALPPWILVDDTGLCYPAEPELRFYSHLSPEESSKWTDHLVKQPAVAQKTPTSQAAYTYHPVAYLYCDDDKALPVEYQRKMVQGAEEATGVRFHTGSVDSGHSPMLSVPGKVLEFIQRLPQVV